MTLRAYECSIPKWGEEFVRVVNARNHGEARSIWLRDIRDCYPTLSYQHIRVRSLGAPRTSDRLARVAAYRGRPELGRAGVAVRAGGRAATVVDADESANFILAFDDGTRGHVHHGDIEFLDEKTKGRGQPPAGDRRVSAESAGPVPESAGTPGAPPNADATGAAS